MDRRVLLSLLLLFEDMTSRWIGFGFLCDITNASLAEAMAGVMTVEAALIEYDTRKCYCNNDIWFMYIV